MASSKTITTMLLVVVMAAAASAATYTIGDTAGWRIPDSPNFYDTWAASKTFRVNDKLVFNFPTGAHTTVRVSENEYQACTFANPMERYTTGPATVTLNDTGAHYYLCDVSGHCAGGQKVSINVVSASSSPPPSKAPSAPSPSAVASPPRPVVTPPASSSPPSKASPAPSPSSVVRPQTPFATPAGSPLPSAGTPPAAGTPGTSSTPSSQPTSSAVSFSRGFQWTTFLALVLPFTFVW